MKRKEIKIFINYAREDFEIAEKIYSDFKDAGVSPWLDVFDLYPGLNWKQGINQAIKDCSYFLALLSSKSLRERSYMQKEQKIALDMLDGFPIDEIFIIPARLDDCVPLDERLQNLHCVDLSDYETGMNEILKTVISRKSLISGLKEKIPYTWHSHRKKPDSCKDEIARFTFKQSVCGVCGRDILNQQQVGGKCLTPPCKNKVCTDCWNAERTRSCKDCQQSK